LTIPEVIAANGEATPGLQIDSAFQSGPATSVFFVHLNGVIEYNDVISPESRSTRFRFRAQMTLGGGGAALAQNGWQKFGPPEDNRAT
jgi:hypothetical protein